MVDADDVDEKDDGDDEYDEVVLTRVSGRALESLV